LESEPSPPTRGGRSTSEAHHNSNSRDNLVTMSAAPPCAELLAQATARRVKEGSLSGAWIVPRLPKHSYISVGAVQVPIQSTHSA
jgi:hypothetical protein